MQICTLNDIPYIPFKSFWILTPQRLHKTLHLSATVTTRGCFDNNRISPQRRICHDYKQNLLNIKGNWVIGVYINIWASVIKYEYIWGGKMWWNVKHASLSDIGERRRAVFVFGEVPLTCESAPRLNERRKLQDSYDNKDGGKFVQQKGMKLGNEDEVICPRAFCFVQHATWIFFQMYISSHHIEDMFYHRAALCCSTNAAFPLRCSS